MILSRLLENTKALLRCYVKAQSTYVTHKLKVASTKTLDIVLMALVLTLAVGWLSFVGASLMAPSLGWTYSGLITGVALVVIAFVFKLASSRRALFKKSETEVMETQLEILHNANATYIQSIKQDLRYRMERLGNKNSVSIGLPVATLTLAALGGAVLGHKLMNKKY